MTTKTRSKTVTYRTFRCQSCHLVIRNPIPASMMSHRCSVGYQWRNMRPTKGT